jgi:outer membrane autotransporter protein
LFLGSQFEAKVLTPDGKPFTYWTRVAWVHEFEPYRTVNPSFIAAPGFNFVINGATAARDAARVDAGSNFGVTRNVALFTNFFGEFSPKGTAFSGSGGFKVLW